MAEANFTIERSANPTPEQSRRGPHKIQPVADSGQRPRADPDYAAGGRQYFGRRISGHVSYGWLFIELLWVDELARSQGQGSRLMLAAKDEALKRGCRKAWVDTFSFWAKRFTRSSDTGFSANSKTVRQGIADTFCEKVCVFYPPLKKRAGEVPRFGGSTSMFRAVTEV